MIDLIRSRTSAERGVKILVDKIILMFLGIKKNHLRMYWYLTVYFFLSICWLLSICVPSLIHLSTSFSFAYIFVCRSSIIMLTYLSLSIKSSIYLSVFTTVMTYLSLSAHLSINLYLYMFIYVSMLIYHSTIFISKYLLLTIYNPFTVLSACLVCTYSVCACECGTVIDFNEEIWDYL